MFQVTSFKLRFDMKQLARKKITSVLSYLFLLSMFAACAAPTERTPTPYPDTPSPAEITAPLVESPAFVSIQFLNELDGWGVTETQIVRTNDGGITWYNVTPPEVNEAGYAIDTFILDNNHVWVQAPDNENFPNGGFLYRTTDGGITWTSSQVPFSRGKLKFLDPNNGWVMAELGIAAGSMGVSVFQTTDSGASWEQKYTNDPNLAGAGESLPLGGLKNGLTPLNMQRAWVYGLIYAPARVYLYRTDDGGENWRELSLPLPEGVENAELSVDELELVAPNFGFLALRVTSDNTNLALYTSDDSGDTWLLLPTLIPNGGSADFLSATEAVIYNGEQFYVTRDAARTWTIIPPDIKFGETFAAMDFVNALSGWVITLDPTNNGRSLYRTSDGGATWSPIVP